MKKPFFARFLETQELDTVVGGSNGKFKTLKYPSDNDEMVVVTMKYPSDGDDDIIMIEE